jgi:hypothetical protein
MGLTIHYGGQLRSEDRMADLQSIALRWAKHWKCDVDDVDMPEFQYYRVRNNKLEEYKGPIKGFALQPHPDSDPLSLWIGSDGFLYHFCKTQFAPPEVHIDIVSFLREIEPHFTEFTVQDEGGYWELNDRDLLEKRQGFLNREIDALAKAFPPEATGKRDRTPKSGDN